MRVTPGSPAMVAPALVAALLADSCPPKLDRVGPTGARVRRPTPPDRPLSATRGCLAKSSRIARQIREHRNAGPQATAATGLFSPKPRSQLVSPAHRTTHVRLG